ncbi:MAG: hypothetical protein Athens071426_474 [Parcubacteria group bacterium Athens0714_26]|nr:MAG: hypothetical protein Athens101426_285 [Parcubacteria group bacterium Athens1014_26]TSD02526.1 MAG: hypothetical protein Athens071426_474 [Parcubacteria group bacterium Athens0714_26]
MNQVNKKDFLISVIIGFAAGLLILPIVRNINLNAKLNIGFAQFSFLAVIGLTALTSVTYWLALKFSGRMPAILQFAKFLIVGGLNFLIDLGILNLLINLTDISSGTGYSAFKAMSFLVAVINSYFLNKYWTFKVLGVPKTGEFIKFFTVNLIGFGINVSTASLVVNVIGAPGGVSVKLWASAGAAIASMVGLIWNFIGMKFVVFKK